MSRSPDGGDRLNLPQHNATTATERRVRVAIAVSSVPVIGAIHYRTGVNLEFHPFFLLPIIAATWYGSPTAGTLTGLFGLGVWVAADRLLMGSAAAGPLIFNGMVRLSVFLIVVLTVTRWKAALARESVLARADALTGLPNRRAFLERGAVELTRARRYRHPTTVLFFDLDAFKTVNDRFGHETGNQVLRVVTGVLRARTRAVDICTRLGGDEFAVLLPETGAEAARAFADLLRQRLLDAMQLHGWPVTFSIGVVTFVTPPEDVEQIVSRADALMYAVKEHGKDSIRAEVI